MTVHRLPGDDLRRRDVVALERVAILGVGDVLRRFRFRARKPDEHDRDQQNENPEREGLGEPSPAELFLVFGRHLALALLQARYVRNVTEVFRVI